MKTYWIVKGKPKDKLEGIQRCILKGKITSVEKSHDGQIIIEVSK